VNIMTAKTSTGTAVLREDDELREMIECALGTPTGYAYVRTACVAAFMGDSLATTWKNHGKALLDRINADIAEARKAEAANGPHS
jgi:hypothetical protein